jgi:acetyl-CoA acetyltransferase
MAIATGAAEVVVIYRSLNERSGRRFGTVTINDRGGWFLSPQGAFFTPYGFVEPAKTFTPYMARYMYEHNVTNEDVAPVTIAARRHAANNPAAYFYERPITLADHQNSRWIVEPTVRLLDCCLESDGAVALVVTSFDRAKDLRQPPARVVAATQGMLGGGGSSSKNYYGDEVARLPDVRVAARNLWRRSGLSPTDIQVANIYEHFAPMVLMQLEELGFCERGEAKDFVKDGRIEIGGELPINTNGGQLGEAYIHGMNGLAEAVRQVRGTSPNQVSNVEHVLATSAPGASTSALILGRP